MSGSSSFLPRFSHFKSICFLIPSHVPRMSHENLVHAFSEPRCSTKKIAIAHAGLSHFFFVERGGKQDTGNEKLKQVKQRRVWIP